MSPGGRPVIVRRRDIEQHPRPAGGSFARMALVPLPVPTLVSGVLGVFCANTTDKVISITYDDGPHPEHTPRILDVLASHGATATFFVLARQVVEYPEITRRIVAEGHQLALHGHDHRSLLTMDAADAITRIREAKQRVEQVAGVPIQFYRPPYGEYTIRQAMGIRKMGLEVVIWSGDAADWLDGEEQAIADRALATVFPGAILLLHDDRGDPETLATGETLPRFDRARVTDLILHSLATEGYRTVSVSSMICTRQQVRSAAKYRMARR